MRISGGIAKGIALKITRTPSLRPATEANRERLFPHWETPSKEPEYLICLREVELTVWKPSAEDPITPILSKKTEKYFMI